MMRSLSLAAFALGLVSPAMAMQCAPTPESHAASFSGTVSGHDAFYQPLSGGWILALIPAEHGWLLRVYDGEPVGDAVDLTALTPPLRGPVNPRDLFGWHFRNAANTAANTGDVNAPQDLRAFVVSPGLAGTGGLRLPEGPVEPSPDDGIGTLRILDKGLADLEPGQRARMAYLAFEGCIRWPKSEEDMREEANANSPDFLEVEHEIFGSCGLDLATYELHAVFTPRVLAGDFDDDDAGDDVAQIRRRADGRRGLALCRAGTWTQVVGMDDTAALGDGYIRQLEAWRVVPPDYKGFADYTGAPDWPGPEGDVIALERIEKELVILYWKDGDWRSQHIYHFVEP